MPLLAVGQSSSLLLFVLVLLLASSSLCTAVLNATTLTSLATLCAPISIPIGLGSFSVQYASGIVNGDTVAHLRVVYGAMGYVAIGQAGPGFSSMASPVLLKKKIVLGLASSIDESDD